MTCTAKGYPKNPQYRWLLNGRIVSDWSNHGNYLITSASQSDEGLYACLAQSTAGVIQSAVVQVSVYGESVVWFRLLIGWS